MSNKHFSPLTAQIPLITSAEQGRCVAYPIAGRFIHQHKLLLLNPMSAWQPVRANFKLQPLHLLLEHAPRCHDNILNRPLCKYLDVLFSNK